MHWDIERHWYRPTHSFLSFALLPLALLFGVIVAMRRFLYRSGIRKVISFPVPIIVVGNISVGGTGKTPLVIWLVNRLKERGFTPAIVSRGYGGKSFAALSWVEPQADPAIVGDEAVVLARRTGCPMVIGSDRVAAVKELLTHTKCNIVISDDGLQHYHLGRTVEIAVIDGDRRFGNQSLLPAGPLREPLSRLQEVDFIVSQGHAQIGEYEMHLGGDEVIALQNSTLCCLLKNFPHARVHAVAAIGNPQRFFCGLRAHGLDVIEHAFHDHYLYHKNDFDFGDDLPIIMTEKDAVKCIDFADSRYWYLPVSAHLNKDFEISLLNKLGVEACE